MGGDAKVAELRQILLIDEYEIRCSTGPRPVSLEHLFVGPGKRHEVDRHLHQSVNGIPKRLVQAVGTRA